jgi:hypothetical protein
MFQPMFIALRPEIDSGLIMSHDCNLVIICGLARSGTTYVGKSLSRAKGIHLINEPLNKDFGVRGVPKWYPYADWADWSDSTDTNKLIRDIIELSARWTRSSPPQYPLITRLSKRLYGGSSGFAWSVLRWKKVFRFPFQILCFKDPFATFAVGHMIHTYNAKAICLTKHPCSLYISQKRRGQEGHIEDLLAQGKLRDRYAGDISADTWKSAMRHAPAGVALLWKIMARAITSQAKDHADLSIVRHEDLCVDPAKTIKEICAHFGIAYGRRIEKFIRRTSRGSQVYAKAGKLHFFKRNSNALKDAWRSVISPQEEAMIRELVGDDIHLLYEQW